MTPEESRVLEKARSDRLLILRQWAASRAQTEAWRRVVYEVHGEKAHKQLEDLCAKVLLEQFDQVLISLENADPALAHYWAT